MWIFDAINSLLKAAPSIPPAAKPPSNLGILGAKSNSHADYQNTFNNDEDEIQNLTALSNQSKEPTKQTEKFQFFENIKYASAFGEAFRLILPYGYRRASYALATGFILKELHVESKEINADANYTAKMGDKFITKMLSCVLIPGTAVRQLVTFTYLNMRSVNLGHHKVNRNVRIITPILVGLIVIPIILTPIEEMVNYGMDKTYRAVLDYSP